MFTIEFDYDELLITVLDEHEMYEDVQLVLYDDVVYIRQWNEEFNHYENVMISPEMFEELKKSLTLPEGAYHTRSIT